MPDLATAIAECLALHAEALEKFGTENPEENSVLPEELISEMRRARENVSDTLAGGQPEIHAAHVAALNRGLRLVMKRLNPC